MNQNETKCATCGHTDLKHAAAHLLHCGPSCPCARLALVEEAS